MNFFNDEIAFVDFLERNRLFSREQRQTLMLKKDQQRHLLMKQQLNRRKGIGKGGTILPDLLDIIVSLQFDIPDEPGQTLTEEAIMRAVAKESKLPYKKLDPLDLDLKTVTKTIPKNYALKHLLLPFKVRKKVYDIAICDPGIKSVLEEIERANQVTIRPHITTRTDIRKMLAEFFGFQSTISKAEDNMGGPLVDLGNLEQYVQISSANEIASTDQHIKGAVDHLFNYAFDQRASDIHIEPKRVVSVIRLRIDGVLHTIYNLPKVVHPAIVSRIKGLSRLDIAEKRRPQDGRIKVDREGKEAEIRVSTIPVAFGEKIVLRILDPEVLFQDLTTIGFSAKDLDAYEGFIRSPHGIILVTGPTGSGKSTTLYSTLKYIATPEKNIITVEDPVEMIHEEFNQISVQPQADVTFATILRAILRQDPDIIMIGEIRDLETATHAIQAALTGHLVFSTLHTNDAVSSVGRLVDLGVQPFLIGSTMLGVLAQRLVRRICPNCAEAYEIDAVRLRNFGLMVKEDGIFQLQKGNGCLRCRSTGYLGRCGLFEIFSISDTIGKMISQGRSDAELREIAVKQGMVPLNVDGWEKVKRHVTTVEEVLRVAGIGAVV